MNLLRWGILFSAIALLAACSSDGEQRPEYMDGYSVGKLEIPPELSVPDSNEELQIPEPSVKALAALKNREGIEGNIAPKFKGIELQSADGMHWLLLQQDADQVWPLLREFLANEGIKIYREEPLLGFIETEWIKGYDASEDENFLTKILNRLSSGERDKFRLRLERIEGKQQTKLYVSHRGLEIIVADEGSSWKQSVPNQMLERELLTRLVLFAGLSQEKADEVLAEYKPYQSRVRQLNVDDPGKYEIIGNQDAVWKRVVQALDRLGIDIKSQNKTAGSLQVLVGEISKEKLSEQDLEDNEYYESNWIAQLFSDEDKLSKDEKGRITVFITLTEFNNLTQMQVSLENNQAVTGNVAKKFKKALINQLK